ncbi:hypothetical protein ASD30_02920 [Nocardioides sp. Root140]|nr:hypothetical protein ASD30_02920 [Nocardioides sp. Root140]KRF15962.1 hypothetical protein ASH02_04925 [Nocardioides sp. Soil796]
MRLPAVQPDAATGSRFPLYSTPPPPPQAPSPPPLFADEVPTRSPEQNATRIRDDETPAVQPFADRAYTDQTFAPDWQPPAEPADAGGSHRSGTDRRKRSPLVWMVPLLLAMVIAAGIGVWLGTRGDDSTDTSGNDDSSQAATDGGSPSAPESTDPSPTIPPPEDADAVDLGAGATASGPKPRRPGTDVNGKRVAYPLTNMFDGSPTTAYRIAGDASGRTVTFSLPEEATIKEVGMINGYAKLDPGANWYDRNRKITKVEWLFDDGTTVEQTLRDTTDMQVMRIDDAVTGTIRMRIVSVSGHKGPPLWDVTAISEVVLRGSTD